MAVKVQVWGWMLCLLGCWLQHVTVDASQCAALDDPHVKHFDVTIPNLDVPANELTSYKCYYVKVPVPPGAPLHAVAFQPLVDNVEVVHHMILFSCSGDQVSDTQKKIHDCTKEDNHCRSWMAQWSAGMEGVICPDNKTGVRFGESPESYLKLQIHWNNGQFRKNLTDHSGMRVYYTSDLRPFDLGHVQVGQQDIEIPAGVTGHAQSGGCSGTCTGMLLPHPIHLTAVHLHMHYLGAGGWLEVVHADGSITQVTHDGTYDFNHPPVHIIHPPVTVTPGDSIRLTCIFNSKSGVQQRNRTVTFGEGSDGEMCYAFVSYFPLVPHFDQCVQLDNIDINCRSESYQRYRECTGHFISVLTSQLLPHAVQACNHGDETGDTGPCSQDCREALDRLESHACLQGRLGVYMERYVLPGLTSWQDYESVRGDFNRECASLSVM